MERMYIAEKTWEQKTWHQEVSRAVDYGSSDDEAQLFNPMSYLYVQGMKDWLKIYM